MMITVFTHVRARYQVNNHEADGGIKCVSSQQLQQSFVSSDTQHGFVTQPLQS